MSWRGRQETELEIEEEIDILMSSDIVSAQMSTKSITFSRAQQGWFFRSDRKVSRRPDPDPCAAERTCLHLAVCIANVI